jgi:hypothetical protein
MHDRGDLHSMAVMGVMALWWAAHSGQAMRAVIVGLGAAMGWSRCCRG